MNAATLACVALFGGASIAAAADKVTASLVSIAEVPAVISLAKGTFKATLRTNSISYKLTYRDLDTDATQAHIHVAQDGSNGGIMVFLCSNLGNGPPGTQACPPGPGRYRAS